MKAVLLWALGVRDMESWLGRELSISYAKLLFYIILIPFVASS
jgi:hypothetical protein